MNVQEYSTSQILPKMGLAIQIFVALSLLFTETGIRIYCNIKSKANQNFKIKNIISFQKLTFIYSLGLLIAALFQGIIMISKYCVSYVMHYNVTLVLNIMLLLFILSNDDVKEFSLLKAKKTKNNFQEFKMQVLKRFQKKIAPMSSISRIEMAWILEKTHLKEILLN